MTLSHPRRVHLDGQEYPYKLKFAKSRIIGQGSPYVEIVVQIGPRYIKNAFFSKLWQADHEEGLLPYHKNSFLPSDVVKVVRTILEEGALPKTYDLPSWRLVP